MHTTVLFRRRAKIMTGRLNVNVLLDFQEMEGIASVSKTLDVNTKSVMVVSMATTAA